MQSKDYSHLKFENIWHDKLTSQNWKSLHILYYPGSVFVYVCAGAGSFPYTSRYAVEKGEVNEAGAEGMASYILITRANMTGNHRFVFSGFPFMNKKRAAWLCEGLEFLCTYRSLSSPYWIMQVVLREEKILGVRTTYYFLFTKCNVVANSSRTYEKCGGWMNGLGLGKVWETFAVLFSGRSNVLASGCWNVLANVLRRGYCFYFFIHIIMGWQECNSGLYQ